MKMFVAAAVLALSAVQAEAGSDLTSGIGGALQAKALIESAEKAAAAGSVNAAKASLTATFVYTFTITLTSSIPTTTAIECNTIVAHGGLGGASYLESADAVASRSGTTATCTMRIPFLWSLANPSAPVIPQITVIAGKRQLTHSLPPTTLPGAGKTVTVTQALKL